MPAYLLKFYGAVSSKTVLSGNLSFAESLDTVPGDLFLLGTLQRRYDGAPGTATALGYACVVDPKTVQSQDLLIIGHIQTSLNELHLAMHIHYTGG